MYELLTSALPRHTSELTKKVLKDSNWFFGDNIVSRVNKIKTKQQALRSDEFKNSKNLQGLSINPKNRQNEYYQKQSREGQNYQQQSKQRKLYHQKKNRH